VPRVKYAMNYRPKNSFSMSYASRKVIFPGVRKAPSAVTLQVFSVGNIVGCAHIIPAIATSSETGDRGNERWIINSHIDRATWNDLYN
jgi:hypothetical protein